MKRSSHISSYTESLDQNKHPRIEEFRCDHGENHLAVREERAICYNSGFTIGGILLILFLQKKTKKQKNTKRPDRESKCNKIYYFFLLFFCFPCILSMWSLCKKK